MKKFDTINVIPFIDIMLVLLTIVLTTASFIDQGKIEVEVPQSQSKSLIQAQDLTTLITITQSGEFFYQNQVVDISTLDHILAQMDMEQKITIKIDANTAFQKFVAITDLLSKYHLKKVSVITAKQKESIGENTPLSSKDH